MTRIHQQTPSGTTAFDGRIAGVFNTVSLILAAFLLFAAFAPA